ncbi:MAG: ABC transporter permease [Phycisphaerales bacterium]
MPRTLLVATREFKSTVLTKGFIIGIVLPLVMGGFLLVLMPVFKNLRPPPAKGTVAVIDRSGEVAELLRYELSSERLTELVRKREQRQREQAEQLVGGLVGEQQARGAMESAAPFSDVEGRIPTLTIEPLPTTASPDAEKESLRDKEGGRLAIIEIGANAVRPRADGTYGGYKPYIRSTLDEQNQGTISRGVQRAIAAARLRAENYDPARVEALSEVREEQSVSITRTGERVSIPGVRYIVPIAFILLLMISAFTGGQYLLTTTIEEKSNRVIEVLLSAVSPMELMVGKILGQMGVGLLILLTYSGLGLAGLIAFALLDVLSWMHLVYLLVFFLLAFFMIASLFAAVGSAVTEVHEAQSLIGPVMIVLIIPWLLMPAIVEDPSSTLAVVLSLTPPIAPFVMVQRIAASSDPIPIWQVAGSIAVSAFTAAFTAWAAAKIFRIGVLMFGKPPNLATLLRWVRQA